MTSSTSSSPTRTCPGRTTSQPWPAVGYVTLVPDRRQDGTNVMAFPTATALHASYGRGSFARHLAEAMALADVGVAVEVRSDFDLSFDLDTPTDLSHPLIREVLPEWLRTILDNRPPS